MSKRDQIVEKFNGMEIREHVQNLEILWSFNELESFNNYVELLRETEYAENKITNMVTMATVKTRRNIAMNLFRRYCVAVVSKDEMDKAVFLGDMEGCLLYLESQEDPEEWALRTFKQEGKTTHLGREVHANFSDEKEFEKPEELKPSKRRRFRFKEGQRVTLEDGTVVKVMVRTVRRKRKKAGEAPIPVNTGAMSLRFAVTCGINGEKWSGSENEFRMSYGEGFVERVIKRLQKAF